jgi:hypothetical protein
MAVGRCNRTSAGQLIFSWPDPADPAAPARRNLPTPPELAQRANIRSSDSGLRGRRSIYPDIQPAVAAGRQRGSGGFLVKGLMTGSLSPFGDSSTRSGHISLPCDRGKGATGFRSRCRRLRQRRSQGGGYTENPNAFRIRPH